MINNCTLEWDTDTSATGSYFRKITSYNHGGIQSSVRVYSTSGAITRYTGAYRHPGQDYTYQFTFYYGNRTPTWVDWELGGLIENTIGIAVFGRNMTTGLRADQRVWWGVFDEAADPWVSAGAEYLAQWVSTDALGWQSSVLEVSRTPGQKLRIRMAAWRNSGNAYGHCYVLGGGGIAEFLVQKKEYVRAIEALLQESAAGTEEHVAETRAQIREFINEKLDKKALTRLHDLYPKSFPGDLAAIRLIELYTGREEDHLAERQIQQFLVQFPEHPYGPKATDTLAQLKTRLKANQFFIATVLPLSGRLAQFASEVLEGIQLAVERAHEQSGMPPVGLIVKDNESDKPSFLEDHATLLNEDQPLAVIGPMLSKNLPVMAEMAERANIPLITPAATFPNVRRLGNFVFSTALTHALQAKRIAGYATGEQGYRRFCILYPDTTYGREQARLFAQEVRQHEGEVIAMESFKEGDSDFSPQIKRLKAEDLKKYGLAVPYDPSRPAGKPVGKTDKRILYTPGFDAIFIPSRASEIGLLAAQLAFHDVKVPLLGTNGWNSPDFLRTADRTVDGAVFVDGFFAESANAGVQDFVQRFQKRFQGAPTLFTMQGYDAAKLVLEAIRRGATSGEAVREFLTTQRDLPTLMGPAGFGAEGTLQRPLALLQVKHGKFVQLD